MDANGSLATLRHGFKCYGRRLHVAFFKAAHELNPELEEHYAANCLGITRQLHFSPRSEKSLDITLSLNGIPIATLELKNPLTGQTVEDARRQYMRDRDPREPIFEFKRRTLVHFAVDTESVLMTTRLAGSATYFLPFDIGRDSGAGNPPDQEGRSYRTAYLWEEVLRRDSLLDLLARFIHLQIDEKRDDRGRKVKRETTIFPRYHQLEAVRLLVEAALREGMGHNYLIEHSAGSGKSNTIGWLAHRLSSLHDDTNQRIFDSVIVVTDRVVLDRQLQDTIYQFEHKRGVVQKIDESSRQLAEALENAVPIIITTLQKFPFVSRQLLKMAKERGESGTVTLPTRRCAVIIDEAHSSQGGETATELKGVLGGEELREKAKKRAEEEGQSDMETLFRSMAKRGRQANLSFFAFTSTPKHKTFAVFGREGKPAHRYTMRQAIEEGFILDVLQQAAAVNPEDKFELVFKSLVENLFVERMDQNEDIFVRFMNDPAFQKVVTTWMASEAYRKLRIPAKAAEGMRSDGEPVPALKIVEPRPEERYVTCVPLIPLKAAAGAFSDPQHVEDDEWEWIAVDTKRRLCSGMFVAQVVGKSMEPRIPDGSWCLFGSPVEGTRQGRLVLVQHRDIRDPDTKASFTVKRYESEKVTDADGGWRHSVIRLLPINPAYDPIVLKDIEEGELSIIAELVEVLSKEEPSLIHKSFSGNLAESGGTG
jgi:type I site-specific restriction-modification system R (restriction) subunit